MVYFLQTEIFQSTPSAWRETGGDFMSYWDNSFQSTPSAWRETFSRCSLTFAGDISIHSLRMEGDCCICPQNAGMVYFNPLPPHGGRLSKDKNSPAYDPFQSTPSAWRETPAPVQVSPWAFYFNPLPPHGGRLHNSNVLFRARNISIHSLRMEGDNC